MCWFYLPDQRVKPRKRSAPIEQPAQKRIRNFFMHSAAVVLFMMMYFLASCYTVLPRDILPRDGVVIDVVWIGNRFYSTL
jgi:hypothetical protein